jgi:hypothetical protein
MVNAFSMSIIKSRSFAIVNLAGQEYDVTSNIHVNVHQVPFVLVLRFVYVHLVDGVLDVISLSPSVIHNHA